MWGRWGSFSGMKIISGFLEIDQFVYRLKWRDTQTRADSM